MVGEANLKRLYTVFFQLYDILLKVIDKQEDDARKIHVVWIRIRDISMNSRI